MKNVYVGARYVPLPCGEWDKTKQYENLSIVSYQGDTYTSRKITPIGIDIANTEYWIKTASFNQQLELYKTEVENIKGDYEKNISEQIETATEDIKNNLSILNTTFYNALKNLYDTTDEFTIKLLGDSITCGNGGTGYAVDGKLIYDTFYQNTKGFCWANELKSILEKKYNCTVNNYGCGGTTSTDLYNHLDDLVENDDDIVIVSIGTNNRRIGDGVNVFKTDIVNIYNYLIDNNKIPIFVSPITSNYEYTSTYSYNMYELDNELYLLSKQHNFLYIPMYKEFNEYLNKHGLAFGKVSTDGTHPNDLGYKIMLNIFLKYFGINEQPLTINKETILPSGYDLNDFIEYGASAYTTTINDAKAILNIPTENISSFYVYNIQCARKSSYGLYFVQILIDLTGKIFKRVYSKDAFLEWEQIAGYTIWTELPLSDGITAYDPCYYTRLNNKISIRGRVGGLTSNGITVGILPEGYRPLYNVYKVGFTNNYEPIGIIIKSTGEIVIGCNNSSLIVDGNYYTLDCSFII